SPQGSRPVQLFGIDPEQQAILVDYARFLAQGTFLAGDERSPLVLGETLARQLGVGLGDRVVLTASDPKGEMVRALFRVSGILEPRPGVDTGVAFTSLDAAASAVGAGPARTEI